MFNERIEYNLSRVGFVLMIRLAIIVFLGKNEWALTITNPYGLLAGCLIFVLFFNKKWFSSQA